MSYTPIDPADCAPGRFGKTSLFNLIRTDLDDLNARISSGGPNAMSDHFNWRFDIDDTHANRSFQDLGGFQFNTADHLFRGRDWDFFSKKQSAGANSDANDSKPDFSVARMRTTMVGTAGCSEAVVISKLKFLESEIVDPISFEAVVKISQDCHPRIGLGPLENDLGQYQIDIDDGRNGIYLVRDDATHWKFVAQVSTGNFTFTPNFNAIFGTWFTVHIDFFSGHADCFVNGVNKGPIITNLPTSTVVGAYIGNAATNLLIDTTMDIDSALIFAGGLLAAP